MDNKVILDCPLCNKKDLHVNTSDTSNGLQQCINCGYSTNDSFFVGDIDIKDNSDFSGLDEFMKKYSKRENDYVWIPSVMQLPIGIYYPSEKNEKLIWKFAPLVKIPEEEQKNYPNPGGGYYEKRYNMEKQLEFADFGAGILEINTVMDMLERDNKSKEKEIKLPELKKVKKDEKTKNNKTQ